VDGAVAVGGSGRGGRSSGAAPSSAARLARAWLGGSADRGSVALGRRRLGSLGMAGPCGAAARGQELERGGRHRRRGLELGLRRKARQRLVSMAARVVQHRRGGGALEFGCNGGAESQQLGAEW
jgi:hypothetical protein